MSFVASEPKKSCLRTLLSAVLGIGSDGSYVARGEKALLEAQRETIEHTVSIALIGTMRISLIGRDVVFARPGKRVPADRTWPE